MDFVSEMMRYLNLNFEIEVGDIVHIKEKYGNNDFRRRDISEELYLLFNHTDAWYVTKKWYNDQLEVKVGDLNTFLSNCRVILGQTNWEVVTKNGKTVTVQTMKELFCPRYSERMVVSYYNKWYNEKIIEATERSMGFKL